MPTVLRVDGFTIMIYLPDREHGPAHVHVFKAGAELIVALGEGAESPAITHNRGMRNAEIIAQGRAVTHREAEDRAAGLRAKAVWYDHASGYLMMVTTADRIFGVPTRAIPSLKGLTPGQLGRVALSPSGGGLHWDNLDIHIGVPGLLLEAIGRPVVASAWGREAGKVKSPAKAKASRANGAKGGRPRKRAAA